MPHKLLLADDSVTIQRVIELTFADEDVQVIAVGNGQQAIERAERDRPDIVLADVGMPERDGYEVAAFIKGNPALRHVPVVLLTGAFEPIDETRARAVGCDGVLVKPFEPQMVISRVKDLLAGRKPSGLWGSSPAAQGPVRPAASHADVPTSGRDAGGPDPLEAYFDRLDAAFTSMGTEVPNPVPAAPQPPPQAAPPPPRQAIPVSGAPPAPPARLEPPIDLSSWDPDLGGKPARPVATQPAPVASEPPRPAPEPPRPAAFPEPPRVTSEASRPAPVPAPAAMNAPAAGSSPSLVDAFAALLSAEQQVQIAPSGAPGRQTGAATAPAAPAINDEVIEEITRRVMVRLTNQTRPTVLDVAERLVREEIERIKQHR